jgi:two-component system, cell cycle response regulator DivK
VIKPTPHLILVADDSAQGRDLLKRRLERAGFSVIEAANGAEAVERTLAWRPDIVLMDLSMPVVDGLEAWRMITDMVASPPPAIALSAIMLGDLRILCAEAGFDAFLSKPVDTELLLERINALCRKADSTAA